MLIRRLLLGGTSLLSLLSSASSSPAAAAAAVGVGAGVGGVRRRPPLLLPFLLSLSSLFALIHTASGAQTCVATVGQYCPLLDGDAVACPAGYYCTGDPANDPVACPTGTHNPTPGATAVEACVACSTGLAALTTGQAVCRACPAGSIYADASTCTGCPSGQFATEGAGTCTACAAGTVSVVGSGVCAPCRPGTYSGGLGSGACTACPVGQYTFLRNAATGEYTPVWGATVATQCVAIPSGAATPLVCLPGTRLVGATCAACPIGYYCPQFSTVADSVGQVRACPEGTTTAAVGALATSDCAVKGALLPFNLARCAPTPGDISALTALTVRAMATSASTRTVYFATATAVYRLHLPTSALELLAGAEGSIDTEGAAADAVGDAARFKSITALAVDLEGVGEASIVVVGDGTNVRLIDVYTRTVQRMGGGGEVGAAGGIALRRDAEGQRWAYVSDSAGHRLLVFSVENPVQVSTLLAGDVAGQSGLQNGYGSAALFSAPMGLAFLERDMAASLILLVADSGNGALRAVDTSTRLVKTWFAPLDRVQAELVRPISVAVSAQSGIVYVADSGAGAGGVGARLVAIQRPFMPDVSVKLVTPLLLEGTSNAGRRYATVMPYGAVVAGTGNTAGYDQLLALDVAGGQGTLEALVQDMRANSADGGGAIATCHLPCTVGGCRALVGAELCGNSFLNVGEECDNPRAGSGCDAATCTLESGFGCLLSQGGGSRCLAPCPTFEYAFTAASYCAPDCAALTPRAGYTINAACVETDIDECSLSTDQCDLVRAECLNTPGTYECRCFSGYFGDGVVCRETAYAIYTLIDIPSLQSSVIGGTDPIVVALMAALKQAYAAELSRHIPEGMRVSGTFTTSGGRTAAQLATAFTSFSLDPTFRRTYARMELVTLFETNALALEVVAVAKTETAMVAMDAALAQALFASDEGVNVVQAPRIRSHKASSFTTPSIQGGWGMNITSVTYNRSCRLEEAVDVAGGEPASFVPVAPRGGCWMVEMLYMGGQQMARSDENPDQVVRRGKNVLYLPRIERNPDTMKELVFAQTLTMAPGMAFPCDVSSTSPDGQGIGAAATACCLRSFGAAYRPHSALRTFLDSDAFGAAVPSSACASRGGAINDTFPYSDIVFEPPSHDSINDLVVGHIEGMPSSEVRLLETLDYTTRTFRVLLALEEGDLRNHASMVTGVVGVDYSMNFFIGLANFKGTGGSVVTSQNAQQRVTVSKSNTLTISTFGANQDPLISSETMQLVRIKVTDFFSPVRYLYYLKVTFTMPGFFQTPADGAIVPLSGIRLIKVSGGQTVTASAPGWQQVCSSVSGVDHIYNDTELQALVTAAQKQGCVTSRLQMCLPPQDTQGGVTFGLPLPIGFVTDADFVQAAATGSPALLQVQLMVQAYDTTARSNVISSLSMAVELSPMGFTAVCESASASQTLADIIDGAIYIGMATVASDWDTSIQKKMGMQSAGGGGPTSPDQSLEFATVTVQSSVMTFAALGSADYFDDPRYQGQTVNMHDLFTVNFLEPLGGIKGGPTPNFDAVKALFYAGRAFTSVTDPITHNMWLVPTAELLAICPKRPSIGKMACVTKIISTYERNVVTRSPLDVVEIRVDDPTSVVELQDLVGQLLLQGGGNDFTRKQGTDFHAQLVSKLGLNNRYRKANIINPIVNWQLDAIQSVQPGLNAYTVCTKIIAIGLITITSQSGQQLGRRLLSSLDLPLAAPPPATTTTTMPLKTVPPPTPSSASSFVTLEDVIREADEAGWEDSRGNDDADGGLLMEEDGEEEEEADRFAPSGNASSASSSSYSSVEEEEDEDDVDDMASYMMIAGDQEEDDEWWKAHAAAAAAAAEEGGNGRQRRLLSVPVVEAAATTPPPIDAGSTNSLVVNIDAPGFDAVTQLCRRIGAPFANCRMVQFSAQLSGAGAAALCEARARGTLETLLNDGFAANLLPDQRHASNVSLALLMDLDVSGCPSPLSPLSVAGRRLLADEMAVIVVSKVLFRVDGASTILDPARVAYIDFFKNTTVMQQLLGGGAVIEIRYSSAPPVRLANGTYVAAAPNSTFLGEVIILVHNVSKELPGGNAHALEELVHIKNPVPEGLDVSVNVRADDAFITDAAKRKIKADLDANAGQSSGGVRSSSSAPAAAIAQLLVACLTWLALLAAVC